MVAVHEFQRARGLETTSIVDGRLLRSLEETVWELGDRLLYISKPLLRGDDVVALQQSLALLGFDPGRVDGIFGALTEVAVSEFQRNYGLQPTGILNRDTLTALQRLVPRDQSRRLVTEVRQRSSLIREATSTLVVVSGNSPAGEIVSDALLSRGIDVVRESGSDESVAQRANEVGAGLVVSFLERSGVGEPVVHYYESFRFRSLHGYEMAERIATEINGDTFGMAGPLLRNSTMTALEIIHGPGSHHDIAHAFISAIPVVFHNHE
jgi:N-acetylmuramoyl-L-alanine amidase